MYLLLHRWDHILAIVLKIDGEQCLAALLSSKPGDYVAYQLQDSRFFVGSYVSFTLITVPAVPAGLVKARYLGTVDNTEEVKSVIKAIKDKLRKIWRTEKVPTALEKSWQEDFEEIP